jgi:hypothetical protein
MSAQTTICYSFYEIYSQYSIGFCGLSSAMGITVFTHELCIVYIIKSFGMFKVKIFPYKEVDNGKKYDGVCPECGDKYKRWKGHTVTPVIYPARGTALVPHKPLERTEDRNTKLVHEDEKENNYIKPYIGEYSGNTPHPHDKK